MSKNKKKSSLSEALVFIGIGFELITFTTVLGYIGYRIDNKYDMSPVGVVSGAAFGFICWFLHLLKLTRKYF